MIVKTKIFEICFRSYDSLSELACAMGISVSQVYRVRRGERGINQKFIVGAMKAFPSCRFDDLFYFVPDGYERIAPGALAKPSPLPQSRLAPAQPSAAYQGSPAGRYTVYR